MESKKINQLATELAPELSDLTIIGDPTTGISKKITLSQMASLFTGTVEEYASLSAFPLVGAADTIYIALDTNIIYRWNTGTSAYVELSPNIVTSLVFNDANGFDGTISLVGSTATLTITTALTTGSVGFIGASGALTQDNANFFWDNSNKRLGINTNAPTTALDVFGSGIIGRVNGTSTNNAFLGFASAGSNKWSIGNVQSDHRFRIYSEANTSELVSILQTGEFGIGIANPLTKLHIFGGASALIANLDANTSVAKSISYRSGNSSRINLEVSGTESGSNAGANFYIRRYSDAGSLIDTPFTILRSTGNIGIGNTTPTSPLHITSTTTGLLSKLESNQADTQIRFYNTGTSGRTYSIGSGSSTSGAINGFYIYDETSTATRFAINASGNIGIANTDPKSLLHLTGGNLTISKTSSGSGTVVGSIDFRNDFASPNYVWAKIEALNGSTHDSSNITFSTWGSGFNTLTEKVRIQSDGNVGIGISTPNVLLHLHNASVPRIQFTNSTTGTTISDGFQIYNSGLTAIITNKEAGDMVFGTSDTERLRIYSGGGMELASGNNLTVGNGAIFTSAGSGTGYATKISTAYNYPYVDTYIDSIAGASYDSRFSFRTNSGGGSMTTRLSIEAGGEVKITGAGSSSTAFSIYDGSSRRIFAIPSQYYGYIFAVSVVSNGGKAISIGNAGGSSEVGSIVANASSTTYNTTSDYRLKEDFKDFDALNIMSKIKFYDFKWKIDEERTTGVIAHELQEIVPYAVNGEKDGIGIDGKPSYQGVDYSKLVAIQGKAIQQLEAKIKQLESK